MTVLQLSFEEPAVEAAGPVEPLDAVLHLAVSQTVRHDALDFPLVCQLDRWGFKARPRRVVLQDHDVEHGVEPLH